MLTSKEEILDNLPKGCAFEYSYDTVVIPYNHVSTLLDKLYKEYEKEQSLKQTAIEEIEYALSKPEYANVYLNNALRFLKVGE